MGRLSARRRRRSCPSSVTSVSKTADYQSCNGRHPDPPELIGGVVAATTMLSKSAHSRFPMPVGIAENTITLTAPGLAAVLHPTTILGHTRVSGLEGRVDDRLEHG